jgi:four helix bundle protein
MGNFKKLNVWQLAKDLAVRIYKLTQTSAFSKDYGLKDQIQRSAVSIPSNIAEGDNLDTDKQSIRHFFIARGSTAELRTQPDA